MLEDMQQHEATEESDSPWSSRVILIQKNRDLCSCVDYRKLNNATRNKCFPLSQTDDTLNGLAGAKWFSTLDLKICYWQVDLHPDDQKAAVAMGLGLWQFMVMPFGLRKAPATFERLLETLLQGLTYEPCLMYLDYMIVIGHTFQEDLLNLQKVFQWFQDAA
jgi:hypothetical protein